MSKLQNKISLLIFVAWSILVTGVTEVHGQHNHHGAPAHNQETEDGNKRAEAPATAKIHHHAVSEENRDAGSTRNDLPEIFSSRSPLSLEDLEAMALENNPRLKQAGLSIRASEGRMRQAGLFPNPVVGYAGEGFSLRNFSDGSRHMFFVEQRIPLGGKLSKSRRVFAREVERKKLDAETERLRVLNSVRLLYYEALGAQKLVEIKKDLATLSAESVEISAALYNVGLSDKPDGLKAEIEFERAEAEYLDSINSLEEVWGKIGALVGKPEILPIRLTENPEDVFNQTETEELLEKLLWQSPEILSAQASVETAKAALRRARAEKTPDLFLRGGIGYNNELIEEHGRSRRRGAEGFVEVGVTLPIFNRNQGGIETAEAELGIAEREVDRLRLELRARFAGELRKYRTSLNLAEKYRERVIPKAKAAYEMHKVNFQNMSASYPKVLETRRAYLEAQTGYAESLMELQKTLVRLKGFLITGDVAQADESKEFNVSAENPVNEDLN